MIEEIKEAIIELEKKNYKIDEILINEDVMNMLTNSFNRVYGENAIELTTITSLFGYEAGRNLFNNIMKAIALFIILYDFTKEEKGLIYKLINFKEWLNENIKWIHTRR